MMNVLVTGSQGFIAKNLIVELKNNSNINIFEYSRETDPSLLDSYCKSADFIFHLAGINRPKDQSEFMDGNLGFLSMLLDLLKKHQNDCPIMLSSSVQALQENAYGISKRASEDLLIEYNKATGASIFVYRFPNVFGKWCKPNYNSAIATFCYNIARDLSIKVSDPNVVMNLVYIDDVVEELIHILNKTNKSDEHFFNVPVTHTSTLGEIVDLIRFFRESRETRAIADMSDALTKKLYSTYLSYLPEDQFSYQLKMNKDQRGSFTEFIKTTDRGQVSINISKPGITKGNHWHHTKNEKFLVVSGKGVIRFRKIGSDKVIEYFVSGDNLEVVDIPVGYTHNIENLLHDTDMITIMWANEHFNPEKPDTYFLGVN